MARLRSPLTQHLLRHTRMAVIQRAVLGDKTSYLENITAPEIMAPPADKPTSSEESIKIARVVILPPNNELPIGQVSPFVAQEPYAAPEGTTPIQQTSQIQSMMTSQAQPKGSETPTPPASEPKSQEKSWNILQTIFRKHEEKKAVDETKIDRIQRQDPTDGADTQSNLETNVGTTSSPSQSTESHPSPPPPSGTSPDDAAPETNSAVNGSSLTAGNANIGGNLMVGGSANVGGSAMVGGSAVVGGNAAVGGAATVGGNAIAGGNLSASSNLSAGGTIQSKGDASAGAIINAGIAKVKGNIQAGSNIIANVAKTKGNVTAGGNITSGAPMKTDGNVTVGGSLTGGSKIVSGGSTTIGGQAIIGSQIQAAGGVDVGGNAVTNVIKSSGNVGVGGSALIGAQLQSAGNTEISGSAQVGSTIKSGGGLSVGSSLTIGGSANIGGSINAGGPVTIAGTSNVSPSGSGGAVQPKRLDESAPASPLQDAWPVQRKLEPQIEVPQVMHDAIPGQVSASPIEIIPPRRPRPQNAPTLIQRTPARAESIPNIRNDASPVPTEIGPLPQDLWHLIGQEPPQHGEVVHPKVENITSRKIEGSRSRPKDQVSSLTRPEITSEFESVSRKEKGPILEPPSPIIQRKAAVNESSSQQSDSDEEQSEVDTDELARKVYAEIKRRLTTEWERFRNHF